VIGGLIILDMVEAGLNMLKGDMQTMIPTPVRLSMLVCKGILIKV
jgi:hypothetical protein